MVEASVVFTAWMMIVAVTAEHAGDRSADGCAAAPHVSRHQQCGDRREDERAREPAGRTDGGNRDGQLDGGQRPQRLDRLRMQLEIARDERERDQHDRRDDHVPGPGRVQDADDHPGRDGDGAARDGEQSEADLEERVPTPSVLDASTDASRPKPSDALDRDRVELVVSPEAGGTAQLRTPTPRSRQAGAYPELGIAKGALHARIGSPLTLPPRMLMIGLPGGSGRASRPSRRCWPARAR